MALSKTLADDLTCVICHRFYSDPRTLNCLHSYCKVCLEDRQAKKVQSIAKAGSKGTIRRARQTIECPRCLKSTKLHGKGVEGLPTNSTLESIIVKYNNSKTSVITCSLCEIDPQPAVKTCRDCSGTNYCQDCLQLYHPKRGTFRAHILLNITKKLGISDESAYENSRVKIATVNHLTFQNTALTKVAWLDEDGTANLYQVKCSLEREEMGHVYQEEIKALTTECQVIMAGLRLNTEYLATVTALHDKNDVILATPQRKGQLKFRTGEKLKYTNFAWDTSDCKATIALSKSRTKVTWDIFQKRELLDICEEFNPSWKKVDGICSDMLFSSGKHYWETLVNYAVLKHMENFDLICSVGISRHGREDSFTPLCRSHYCLCLALMKAPGFPDIVMKGWDGRNQSRSREVILGNIMRHSPKSVRIGFYLDFGRKLFKVVDVQSNKLVITFKHIDWPCVSAICELYNADKTRCSVELFTEGFDEIPSALFD